jgi:hypothetical protein
MPISKALSAIALGLTLSVLPPAATITAPPVHAQVPGESMVIRGCAYVFQAFVGWVLTKCFDAAANAMQHTPATGFGNPVQPQAPWTGHAPNYYSGWNPMPQSQYYGGSSSPTYRLQR